MFLGISKRINIIALFLLFFSISANGMEAQKSRINSLLSMARENSGKLLFGTGAVTAAWFGYSYWSPIKRCLTSCLRSCFSLGSNRQISISNSANWRHIDREERQIPITTQNQLTVDNGNGNIDVDTHDLPHLSVLITKRGATLEDLRRIQATITQDASGIMVKTELLEPIVNALIHYKITAPHNHVMSHNLKTINGNVTVQNINSTAQNIDNNVSVEARTSNGNVKLRTIGGKAIAETINGDAQLANITNSVQVRTSNGNQTIKNIHGQRTVCESVNGDVTVEDALDVQAQSSNGTVKVKNVRSAALTTVNGDIVAEEISSDQPFKAQSVTGSVKIRNRLFNFPCTISTTMGDISLAAQALNARAHLQATFGTVKSDFMLHNVNGLRSDQRNDFTAEIGEPNYALNLSSGHGNISLDQQ